MDKPVSATKDAAPGCPFCWVYQHSDPQESGCLSCRGFLSEGLLEALRRLPNLSEVLGAPAYAALPATVPAIKIDASTTGQDGCHELIRKTGSTFAA